jgi:hypothetical protein
MRIYLAGGLQTNWQDEATFLLMQMNPNMDVHDPRTLKTRNLPIEEIADIEREWIRNTDVVLAFLEEDNPLPIFVA